MIDPVFLVNPSSGRGRGYVTGKLLRQVFDKYDFPFQVIDSKSEEDFLQLVRANLSAPALIAVGGDSTFWLMINEAMRLNYTGKYGFLGSGTSNDIALVLNTMTIDKLLEALVYQTYEPMDLIHLRTENYETFIPGQMNLGLGAHVNNFVANYYRSSGHLKQYCPPFWVGLRGIFRSMKDPALPVRLQISTATKTWEGEYGIALFSNIPLWSGGKRFLPEAQLSDGKIHAALIPHRNIAYILRLALSAGSNWYQKKAGIQFLSEPEIEVRTSNPEDFQIDGEVPATAQVFSLKAVPSAIKVLRRSV